jgi:aminobenzoyl-glutamate utilization protein B
LCSLLGSVYVISGQPGVTIEKEAALKADLAGQIDGMKKRAQVMVDTVFRFGELGFQEFAWDYFNDVQTKGMKYKSLLRPEDRPAIWLNQKTMEEYRPRMKAFYYDASKYDSYLEQLGIKYPTVRRSGKN